MTSTYIQQQLEHFSTPKNQYIEKKNNYSYSYLSF